MTDPLQSHNTNPGHAPGPHPRAPRWVKVSAIVAVAVVAAVVLVLALGIGGDHGPGRHSPGGEPAEPAQDQPGGHEPPEGAHG